MKKRRLYCSPVALALVGLSLGQLGGTQVMDTLPLPDPPALVENFQAPFTASAVLSLQAGSRRASVCGELEDGSTINTLVRLSVRPYIEDGVMYIPLEEVIRILGGSCRVEGDTATAVLQGTAAVYQAGQAKVRVGRRETVNTETPSVFTFYTPDNTGNENAVPVVKAGRFYIPLDFIRSLVFHCGDPESNSAQIGNFYGDINLGPYSVADDGRRLEDFPTEGLERGEIAAVIEMYGFGARCYEGSGLTLYIFEEVPGEDWRQDGLICGILCTQRGIATPRGLQVGDTLDWARFLYGPLEDHGDGLYEAQIGSMSSLYLEAEDGVVTSIGVYNRFWAPLRLVEENNRQYEAQQRQEQNP